MQDYLRHRSNLQQTLIWLHIVIQSYYYKELLDLTFHFLRAANFLNFSIFTAEAFLLSACKVSLGCKEIKKNNTEK